MKDNDLYYVTVLPKNTGDFRPLIIDYGLTYEKANNVMRRYIQDHGMRFKKNGKHYPAFVYIYKITQRLPKGYYLFSKENDNEQDYAGKTDR